MRERVHQLGGSFEISTGASAKGTMIFVCLPSEESAPVARFDPAPWSNAGDELNGGQANYFEFQPRTEFLEY